MFSSPLALCCTDLDWQIDLSVSNGDDNHDALSRRSVYMRVRTDQKHDDNSEGAEVPQQSIALAGAHVMYSVLETRQIMKQWQGQQHDLVGLLFPSLK